MVRLSDSRKCSSCKEAEVVKWVGITPVLAAN